LDSLGEAIPGPLETIVVADGDSDGSWRVAEEFGATVIRLPNPRGPAGARNAGAGVAKGDILFFVDADVAICSDALAQVAAAFQSEPDLAALFGSYDEQPGATNFLSQYRNLFHHLVHQQAREDAVTFFGACGAIRREVFLSLGGFDQERYRHPCVEDIELGYRLKRAGHRIRLCKGLQVKHLKKWTAGGLLKADFFYRALPWTELILQEGRFVNDLNLRLSSRVSVALAHSFLLSLVGSLWWTGFLLMAAGFVSALLLINAPVYRFFYRKRGLRFMLGVFPWHLLYFFYCGLAFVVGAVRFFFRNRRLPAGDITKRPGVQR
jgi:GT2 family glycosyltransferase